MRESGEGGARGQNGFCFCKGSEFRICIRISISNSKSNLSGNLSNTLSSEPNPSNATTMAVSSSSEGSSSLLVTDSSLGPFCRPPPSDDQSGFGYTGGRSRCFPFWQGTSPIPPCRLPTGLAPNSSLSTLRKRGQRRERETSHSRSLSLSLSHPRSATQ